MKMKLIAGVSVTAMTLVLIATTVLAWLPLRVSAHANGCESITVTAENPENEVATVRAGNLLNVLVTIPAHGQVSRTFDHGGTFTVTVNYPSDQTLRTASVDIQLPVCPTTTTTSTTVEPTTTTTVPDTTSTVPASSTTTDPVPTTATPAPPAVVVPVVPTLAG